MRHLISAASLLLGFWGSSAAACGTQQEPCVMGDRMYYIETPDAPAEGNPALIYLHGYGGSGMSAMRNRGLVEGALERGYAVVAPNGLPMGAGRSGFRWAFRGADQALEITFLNDLRDDLGDRFDIGPDNIVLSGFSNGAFMVAYLACQDPDAYPAYAAIAGGFWRPDPAGCVGPVKLHMTHGWTDGVVPLEGRILRGESRNDPAAVVQGDIFRTLEIFRISNDCRLNRPEDFAKEGDYMIRTWNSCGEDAALEFALHPGGHGVPRGWVDLALDWAEAL